MRSEHIRLHSLHNPVREAERFVSLALGRRNPRYIVITEPGESYTAPAFHTRFPGAICIALRYTPDLFSDTDTLWDMVWRPGSGVGVLDFLFQAIPEEYLSATVFLSWKPSDTRWSHAASGVWNEIAELVQIQSAVIRTRAHFGKRWLVNAMYNMVFSRNPVVVPPITLPVFLACAGPSLEKVFPFQRKHFFVASVSSAMTCLLHNEIRPDMCITTDGGYWAKEHFRHCPVDTVVTFPPEAAIPRTILGNNPLLLLTYSSALEQELFRRSGILPLTAERNGTVAGTAAALMLRLSDQPVVAAGLDLQETASFMHARPHSFDTPILAMTDRTCPLATGLHERAGGAMALNAYARWFAGHAGSFSGRFFRTPGALRDIPGIPSAATESFYRCGSPVSELQPQNVPDCKSRSRIVADFLEECSHNLWRTPDLQDTASILVELVQLVNFSGYTAFVSGGDSLFLCRDTAEFLETLAGRIRFGEK